MNGSSFCGVLVDWWGWSNNQGTERNYHQRQDSESSKTIPHVVLVLKKNLRISF